MGETRKAEETNLYLYLGYSDCNGDEETREMCKRRNRERERRMKRVKLSGTGGSERRRIITG